MGKRGVVASLGSSQNLSFRRERGCPSRRNLSCRILKLDRSFFLLGLGRGCFWVLLWKPGTWHALPLGESIGMRKNRLMLRQASFLVSIRCSG